MGALGSFSWWINSSLWSSRNSSFSILKKKKKGTKKLCHCNEKCKKTAVSRCDLLENLYRDRAQWHKKAAEICKEEEWVMWLWMVPLSTHALAWLGDRAGQGQGRIVATVLGQENSRTRRTTWPGLFYSGVQMQPQIVLKVMAEYMRRYWPTKLGLTLDLCGSPKPDPYQGGLQN